MTKRAAIYSRFSTDRQNEKSTADQESAARAFAKRQGYVVVRAYSDAAMSGASTKGRTGLQQLLDDARAGEFAVVLVEALDRLSRDMEDLARIHKNLTFAGVSIETIHEGVANTVQVGLRGLVGQLFREDNAQKTRRGMAAKVRDGLIASGIAYGYEMDTRKKGSAIIKEAEADVVRRIYSDYVGGRSSRQIAHQLNAEGVTGPRGGKWQPTAIQGWPQRATGILRNPIYDGRIVWNRMRFIKDPETGRRVSRSNPREEWQTADAEHLRIVSANLFAQVQARLSAGEKSHSGIAKMRRPTRLLSGLLRCAACGGGMSVVSKDKSGRERIICTRHRDMRTCPAPKTFYLDLVENETIDALRSMLKDPELLADYVRAYNDARRELMAASIGRRRGLEKQISTAESRLDRITRLLVDGIGEERRLGDEMKTLSAEVDQLKAELSNEPSMDDVVILHPTAINRYESQLRDLKSAIEAGRSYSGLADRLRDLVETVTVSPNAEKRGAVRLAITGKLRKLLDIPNSHTSVGYDGCGSQI